MDMESVAIGPVLKKLVAFHRCEYTPPEGSQLDDDVRFMLSNLEPMYLLLRLLWGREDLEAECKRWMMDARELCYDMEDAIDCYIEGTATDRSLFEDLKIQLEELLGRFCDDWKAAEPTSNLRKHVADPRDSFVHEDASESELLGMDELKDEVIDLLTVTAEGVVRPSYAASSGRIGVGTPHPWSSRGIKMKQMILIDVDKAKDEKSRSKAIELVKGTSGVEVVTPTGDEKNRLAVIGIGMDRIKLTSSLRTEVGSAKLVHVGHTTVQMSRKIVFKVHMPSEKSRSKAMALVAAIPGVESVAIAGEEKDRVVVVGSNIDPVDVLVALRTKMGHADILSVGLAKAEKAKEQQKPVEPAATTAGHHRLTVCILGYAGAGKTALAALLYRAASGRFQCHAFVSVSPSASVTDVLGAILTQVAAATSAATEAVDDLVALLSKHLQSKRYLVIIDNCWHLEQWNIISESLPRNNLGSRIVMTTRINAIAEKCHMEDDGAFVYEIGVHDPTDAWKYFGSPSLESYEGYPCYDIVEMCYGMPLALIHISSALAGQVQRRDGELHSLRVLRLVEDGILSLKPLAESLSLGYKLVPLHLRAFLLYCSIYRWRDKFERDSLIKRWVAENFVHEEEAAQNIFDDLVNTEWIKPVEAGKYEIHPMMLAFLRCKSQEDNFVTCLGFGSDTSSLCASSRRIRRLSLQYGHSDLVDISELTLELSYTRSLVVFDHATAVPFKRFERLRVLDLEDTKDLQNEHLVEICGLRWLRFLGLKGTPISEIPPDIRDLQHLETLDVRDTTVSELPLEAGLISKSLRRVLAGDRGSREAVRLPEGVSQELMNGIPADSRKLLRIVVSDRFGVGTIPPHVGVFKVRGKHMRIPPLIKNHFRVLHSLDISLYKLDMEGDDLEFLQKMPNLQTLVLRLEVLPRKPLVIRSEGFSMLESFCVDSRVPRVTFEEKAMPNLKLLAFKFYVGPASNHPVGIGNLQSLQKVVFRCSDWYKSDSPGISSTIDVVRREAMEHPNLITICINDFPEIEESAQISQSNGNVAAGSSGLSGMEGEADMLHAHRNSRTTEIEVVQEPIRTVYLS